MTDPLHIVCPHCHTTNRVARCACRALKNPRFRNAHLIDKRLVQRSVRGVLVGGEELHTAGDQAFHRFAILEFDDLPR